MGKGKRRRLDLRAALRLFMNVMGELNLGDTLQRCERRPSQVINSYHIYTEQRVSSILSHRPTDFNLACIFLSKVLFWLLLLGLFHVIQISESEEKTLQTDFIKQFYGREIRWIEQGIPTFVFASKLFALYAGRASASIRLAYTVITILSFTWN